MRSNVADRYTRHAGRTAAWGNSLGEELIGPKRILLLGGYVDGEEEVPEKANLQMTGHEHGRYRYLIGGNGQIFLGQEPKG